MRVVVAGVVCLVGGCFAKPGFGNGQPPTPDVRLISKAFANSFDHLPHLASSPGMTGTTWEISAAGVEPNDLLLLIGNVDNGSDNVWGGLATLGFTQLVQQFYNGGDGQTFVAAWKIATASEPATYSGTFGDGIASAAATIALVGITDYDDALTSPVTDSIAAVEPGFAGTMPSTATSPGVTTRASDSLLIWATGSDWLGSEGGSNTFDAPAGFTSLVTLGDRGNNQFDWSSEQIAYRVQPAAGASGEIHGTLTGTVPGTPWDMVLVVPPDMQHAL